MALWENLQATHLGVLFIYGKITLNIWNEASVSSLVHQAHSLWWFSELRKTGVLSRGWMRTPPVALASGYAPCWGGCRVRYTAAPPPWGTKASCCSWLNNAEKTRMEPSWWSQSAPSKVLILQNKWGAEVLMILMWIPVAILAPTTQHFKPPHLESSCRMLQDVRMLRLHLRPGQPWALAWTDLLLAAALPAASSRCSAPSASATPPPRSCASWPGAVGPAVYEHLKNHF